MKRKRPWSLEKVLAANRNAITVYAALRWLAGDVRRLGTTRQRIAEVCGLYRDTISAALHALSEAGWLVLRYGRQGVRTWYRITFPVSGFFPVSPKTRASKRAATGKSPTQETVSCVGENPTHPLKGIGTDGAPTRRPSVPDATAEIERRRMAEIRASRLGSRSQTGVRNA